MISCFSANLLLKGLIQNRVCSFSVKIFLSKLLYFEIIGIKLKGQDNRRVRRN